jgi:hypothetical protein
MIVIIVGVSILTLPRGSLTDPKTLAEPKTPVNGRRPTLGVVDPRSAAADDGFDFALAAHEP